MAAAVLILGTLAILSTNIRQLLVAVLGLAVRLLTSFWKGAIVIFLILIALCCA